MKDNRKTEEMSVEDILKSIKGIINGNNVSRKPEDDENILELTDIANENVFDAENDATSALENKGLLSEQVVAKVSKSFKHLVEKVEQASSSKSVKDMSIEEVVVGMLRPQLKEWLDENLPSLVNKLVEKEIRHLVISSKK